MKCIFLFTQLLDLRCKIQLMGRLRYFIWLLRSDLLQELVEEAKV